ncbi:MAG: homoserine O-succinyltransferase, partial [Alloprevotella sp.]|nr:homoserine O-succinyltransferase [Alloprevotella sp.]
MLYVNSQIPAIESLARLGFSLSVGQEPTLPTVGLLNLMPQKPETEFDFCKMLSTANLDVNLVLLKIPHQHYKTTPQAYVDAHYVDYAPSMAEASEDALVCGCGEKQVPSIDGLIVTGAPLEQMPFEDVRYWKKLQNIWDWTAHCGIPTLNICWAAQAALNHFYGWGKRPLSHKCFGIFAQRNLAPQHPLLYGLGETFPMPHSRHTEVYWGDTDAEATLQGGDTQFLPEGLEVLTDSEVGQSIFYDATRQQTFVTGHL